MQKTDINFSKMNALLCGLAFTSRTETLEEYLKDKVNSLVVIALSSCFLEENLSSCRIYEKGIFQNEFKMANFRIKDYKWYRQPLIVLVFLTYFISICLALIRLRKRYDIYIGISYSFALWGAILKKFRIVKHLIYYCIDYYIPNSKIDFNRFLVKLLNIIDRFTVKNSDYVWDISPNISEYREMIGKIKRDSYKHSILPLGYSSHMRRFKSLNEINRWDIGFIGTITASQGLQLLIEVMPEILERLPEVNVKIIGYGHYLKELKKIISEKKIDNYFTFFGFIKKEEDMLSILSNCAISIALWNVSIDDKNIICADPGKTKLYALCGLPIITTKYCSISEIIKNKKAGLVIDYNQNDLIESIVYLLENDERLKEFRLNSFNLGEGYIADNIFDEAFKDMESKCAESVVL